MQTHASRLQLCLACHSKEINAAQSVGHDELMLEVTAKSGPSSVWPFIPSDVAGLPLWALGHMGSDRNICFKGVRRA